MLLTLGVFVLLASFLGGIAAGTEDAPVAVRLAGIMGTLVLNVSIFLVAYRVLTVEDVRWRTTSSSGPSSPRSRGPCSRRWAGT